MRDKVTNLSRGFCFVEFHSAEVGQRPLLYKAEQYSSLSHRPLPGCYVRVAKCSALADRWAARADELCSQESVRSTSPASGAVPCGQRSAGTSSVGGPASGHRHAISPNASTGTLLTRHDPSITCVSSPLWLPHTQDTTTLITTLLPLEAGLAPLQTNKEELLVSVRRSGPNWVLS